jgi:hypothetical protein
MKKILTLGFILVFISAAASAQHGPGNRIRKQRVNQGISNNHITRPERHQLRKDVVRYKAAQRIARRDGVVSPLERRRLNRLKTDTRRDAFRFRHNGRNRLI